MAINNKRNSSLAVSNNHHPDDLNTSFFAFERIFIKQRNQQYLRKLNSSVDSSLYMKFVVKPDARMLNLQAEIFALNYANHGYLNLPKILRCSGNDVQRKLSELYIYSYVKCLYNGLFYSSLNNSSDLGLCFTGHSSMFHVIRSTGVNRIKDEFAFDCRFKHGDEDVRRVEVALLVGEFSFLKQYDNFVDNFGNSPFLIPEIERLFRFLNEDYYAIRSAGGPSVKYGREEQKSDEQGKIKITTLDSAYQSSILRPENYPVANAFTDSSGRKLYFIEVNGNYSIENNPSFFFSKANFLVASDDNNFDLLEQRYYHTKDLGPDEDFLVASEVFTITGIYCKFISINAGNSRTRFQGAPVDQMVSRICEDPKFQRTTEKILEIADLIYTEIISEDASKGK